MREIMAACCEWALMWEKHGFASLNCALLNMPMDKGMKKEAGGEGGTKNFKQGMGQGFLNKT